MAEPEEVILEGAHRATRWVARLWRRNRAGGRSTLPELADVSRRLELFAAAICADAPPIGVAEPPAPPGLLARLLRRIPAHLVEYDAISSTDGARIRLPRRVGGESAAAVVSLYQLLAVEQAMRAIRGIPAHLPADPALRDLYLLAEGVAIDGRIATDVPGLRATLLRQRQAARSQRAHLRGLTGPERTLERWLLAALDAPPERPPEPMRDSAGPAESLAWARTMLPALLGDAGGRYRGMSLVPHWGRTDPPPPQVVATGRHEPLPAGAAPERSRTLSRRPKVREAGEDEDDQGPGICMVPTQDRQDKAEDPMGLSRPVDRDDAADLDELADSLAELPEARLVRTNTRSREALISEDPPSAGAAATAPTVGAGIRYPEWDYRRAGYRIDHVTVWRDTPLLAPAAEAAALVRRNAPLVAGVRRRFERCKPRRVRRGRQTDGPDIDLDAFVAAFADRRAGGPLDDRLYETHRPLRRELAITLLVDVSASTDGWVSARRRIIDVERDALLVVSEALDALGDRYAILAFSGQGPGGVTVSHVKDFGDAYGPGVQRRIAALEPQHFTRLGAAIRHASAGLAQQAVGHRLLLVLSDGKPNDVDAYEGRYGIEDARQAVAEARMQHIRPFCLTVDREAPAYMTRIFGQVGFATLRDARALTAVLVDVISEMVRD